MNVNFNLISTNLTPEEHTAAVDAVKAVEALLPFAVTLPPDEKDALPGTGVKNNEFISKAYEYAKKNPDLVPQFLDMAEFEKDAILTGQLQVLKDHMVPLLDKLSDTHMLAGSEAYNAARVFYHHVKNAAKMNVPGASAIAKELGKRFKISKSTDSTDSSGQDQGTTEPAASPLPEENVVENA